MQKQVKKWWIGVKTRLKKALEEMAEENKKQFGSGRLDCCDLNEKNRTSPKE